MRDFHERSLKKTTPLIGGWLWSNHVKTQAAEYRKSFILSTRQTEVENARNLTELVWWRHRNIQKQAKSSCCQDPGAMMPDGYDLQGFLKRGEESFWNNDFSAKRITFYQNADLLKKREFEELAF